MPLLQGSIINKHGGPYSRVALLPSEARSSFPSTSAEGDTSGADLIVLAGALDETHDVMGVLREIWPKCTRKTRVAVVSYSKLRRGSTKRHHKSNSVNELNWLPRTEVVNVLELAGFEVIKQTPEVLMTHNLGPISRWVNRWLTPLPLFRQFAVAIVTLARKIDQPHPDPSLSIIIPTRNEAGNIQRILSEIPRMAANQELIFVEGNSTDDTWQVLQDKPPPYLRATRTKSKFISKPASAKVTRCALDSKNQPARC